MINKILAQVLIFVFAFVFIGCSFKQETIDINHYSIDFKTKSLSNKPKYSSILIEDVNINKSFNQTAIFYSLKPYLFEEYAKNRWINLPSNMIYNQLLDSFTSSNIFENVVSNKQKIKSEYILKTDLIKLYQVFKNNKSYAVLKLKFDLVKDEKIIKSINFGKEIICDENSAYGFVKAVNGAFEEMIGDLLILSFADF